MDITITRERIAQALRRAASATSDKTLPVLGNVLIATDGPDHIRITGSDLEAEITTTAVAEIQTPGSTTIPAKKLSGIVNALNDNATVRIKTAEQRCSVTAGTGRFALATLSADDFPSMDQPHGQGFTAALPSAQLKRIFQRTQHAQARGDVRYYLNGTLLESTGQHLIAVATDGHRLARASVPCTAAPAQRIIPAATADRLLKLLPDTDAEVTLTLFENAIQLTVLSTKLTSKLIDGRYPEYQRVIPNEVAQHFTVSRGALQSAILRTHVLANEHHAIKLTAAAAILSVTSSNGSHEIGEEQVDISGHEGQPITAGFSAPYLLDALNCLAGETVRFETNGTDRDAYLLSELERTDQHEIHVLMPMRL
jgi:DNA polymerase III subunit beta